MHSAATPGRESGFTLIELLIVLVTIGILLSIAVPSYVGLRQRASDTTAKSLIREASAAASVYALENHGAAGDADNNASTRGFQGMTTARLRTYDRGIKTALTVLASKTNVNQFCLRVTVNGRQWSALGPGIGSTSFKNNLTCA